MLRCMHKSLRIIHPFLVSGLLCILLANDAPSAPIRSSRDAEVWTRSSPAQAYIHFALAACDNTEKQLPEITRVAEIVAQRHINGGLIGFPRAAWYVGHGLEEELWGRSGQIIHVSFDRPYKTTERSAEEKANDVLIEGWTREPAPDELENLKKFKDAHCFIIGFGPKSLPSLAEEVKMCDAWFDTGYGDDDRAVTLGNGLRVGRGNLFSDVLTA